MEKWVLMFTMIGGGPEPDHLIFSGPFSSETACIRRGELMNLTGAQWLGRCISWKEFTKRWPEARLEGET